MPDKRQELYERIRASSKDEVILEEMIRLGFWPAQGHLPDDPADEIRQRAALEQQLAALRTEQSRLHNIEALKKPCASSASRPRRPSSVRPRSGASASAWPGPQPGARTTSRRSATSGVACRAASTRPPRIAPR
jgi:hypothetical protein